MHAGKNMGIMTTLEKNLLQKGGGGEPAAALGHDGLSLATVLCSEASIASPNAHEHIGTLL